MWADALASETMKRSGHAVASPARQTAVARRGEGCFNHACPVCAAEAGKPCVNRNGTVCRTHTQRRRLPH